ncbi:hypothetical protein P1X14_20910 [Sphingomonas sp. AOB5]|uniref:hypothetical protein n=1 Tax=Sphingomonas sp. AOB5 TaxID=3034017 RepID=UPI0023F70DBE|nr:hypothetical protein [Sphingomonas sp. AOB5]MDF7777729.1 hypothetical protein [Sphingomonas sp. AOB5]
MRIRNCLIAAGLAAALVLPGIAAAKDKAEGWANWTARAERIFTAIAEGDSARLDSACKGVTGVVIGQGFQFPGWARALIQVCTVTQAAYHGSGNNRRSKQICNDLASVSKQIGKSTEVPEGPGAHKVAQKISKVMIEVRDQVCVNFR